MTRCVVWRPKLFPRPQITSDCWNWLGDTRKNPGPKPVLPSFDHDNLWTQNLGATLTVWWTLNLEECFDFSVSRDDFLSAHGPDLGWRCLNRLPAAMWIVCQALCFSTWGVKFVETARNARPASVPVTASVPWKCQCSRRACYHQFISGLFTPFYSIFREIPHDVMLRNRTWMKLALSPFLGSRWVTDFQVCHRLSQYVSFFPWWIVLRQVTLW